jgi:hypothetical protein
MFEIENASADRRSTMPAKGETALQSPVVMTIRHVSGAGMYCLFRCFVIILGLIFEEVEGGVTRGQWSAQETRRLH